MSAAGEPKDFWSPVPDAACENDFVNLPTIAHAESHRRLPLDQINPPEIVY